MNNSEKKKELLKEYYYLNSKESKQFTEDFLSELGKEVDKMFPGVSYVMSLRFKSLVSVEGKINRIIKRDDPQSKNIYDNIGLKIVVTHINNKVKHVNCQQVIEEREKLNNKKQEKESQKNNMINEVKELLYERLDNLLVTVKEIDEEFYKHYAFMINLSNKNNTLNVIEEIQKHTNFLEEYIKENDNKIKITPQEKEIRNLKDELRKEKINSKIEVLEQVRNNIEYERELYNVQDRECNNLFSQYMLEQIKNNSKVLKKFKIASIPGRYRRHTGSTHYYVASHNSFKTNKKARVPDWKIEMQVTSDYYNQDASVGKAKHSEKDGKARVLPNIPANYEEYKRTIKPVVPETYVYINGTGKVRKCSDFESFYSYYQEVIHGQDYLKNLERCLNINENREQEK